MIIAPGSIIKAQLSIKIGSGGAVWWAAGGGRRPREQLLTSCRRPALRSGRCEICCVWEGCQTRWSCLWRRPASHSASLPDSSQLMLWARCRFTVGQFITEYTRQSAVFSLRESRTHCTDTRRRRLALIVGYQTVSQARHSHSAATWWRLRCWMRQWPRRWVAGGSSQDRVNWRLPSTARHQPTTSKVQRTVWRVLYVSI